jgi:hypothetical protein
MDNQFIPSPDFAICPSCKEKVDLPERGKFRIKSKSKEFRCPFCDSAIEYIEPVRFLGPPYSME